MTTDTLLPVSVRLTGRPRRLQPAICSVDLLRFIFRAPSVEADPAKGVTFLTLEAARNVLEELIRHPEGQAYNTEACQRLLVWLRGYPQVRQHAWLN
jgi:hypothetical protein